MFATEVDTSRVKTDTQNPPDPPDPPDLLDTPDLPDPPIHLPPFMLNSLTLFKEWQSVTHSNEWLFLHSAYSFLVWSVIHLLTFYVLCGQM